MSALSYAIIGTGAIGGYFGGRLQRAGCDVHFLLRSDYQYVRQSGLRIDSIEGDFVLPQVKAYNNPADMPPVDVVIVALKTTHNHRLWALLPQIKPGGAILSLQNGFGVEARMAQQLMAQQLTAQQLKETKKLGPTVLGGLCFICSNKVGPGHFHHMDYGKILLGAHTTDHQPGAPTPLMKSIAADFLAAGVPVDLTDDLPMARWEKLVWNVPYNGLSVVLEATTEEMMADDNVRSLIVTLMEEVVAIANAWGQNASPNTRRSLPPDVITTMFTQTESMPPYRTRMKIDYDEKRPLEIEAIFKSPIGVAQALGVSVPAMVVLYQQLAFLNPQKSID